MDSKFNFATIEPNILKLWDKSGLATPQLDPNLPPEKRYSILLPPPNANADLHAGHAMYVIEDILIRYHRLLGDATLWIPGLDHAGFETQYVYEKHLKKTGQSRFDFDRNTLYKNIEKFVADNSGKINSQLKRLGFSLDWSRSTYMLDPHVIETVYDNFEKMIADNLIYRDNYIVNYCPKCGTTFSNLETIYREQIDPLYYIKYGPLTIATVRPETKFGDTAIAVHPDDKRYQKYIDREIQVKGLIGQFKLKVIADPVVDPEFGTGVVKVTPAHDPNDFALSKRHQLKIKQVIDYSGRLNRLAGPYQGLTVYSARRQVVADLKAKGLLVKVDQKYTHSVAHCYKGNHPIEPLILPNWFIRMQPLAQAAINAQKQQAVTFIPAHETKNYLHWLNHLEDWAVSRQIVWGIRIPAWYRVDPAGPKTNQNIHLTFLDSTGQSHTGLLKDLTPNHSLAEIKKGLQSLRAPTNAEYLINRHPPLARKGEFYLPETDTFDTWFSSSQWPLTTLHYPHGQDFKYFYPTSLLDTGRDILNFWVARMIMLGLYLTGQVPFRTVYLHSMVVDKKGQKMSKSKGNVINPMKIIDQYGTDALRIALVIGTTPGRPVPLSDNKIRAYRNFANKIWNATRLIYTLLKDQAQPLNLPPTPPPSPFLTSLNSLIQATTADLNSHRLGQASEKLYAHFWGKFCDQYLENAKSIIKTNPKTSPKKHQAVWSTLLSALETYLILLHPFVPFVTEAAYQKISPLVKTKTNLNTRFNSPYLAGASWPQNQL